VLQQFLVKIDRVFSLIEEHRISTERILAFLTLLSKACKYICTTSQDEFSLHETSMLDNFDAAFRRFLSRKMLKDDDGAREELQSCEQFAGRSSVTCKHIIN